MLSQPQPHPLRKEIRVAGLSLDQICYNLPHELRVTPGTLSRQLRGYGHLAPALEKAIRQILAEATDG